MRQFITDGGVSGSNPNTHDEAMPPAPLFSVSLAVCGEAILDDVVLQAHSSRVAWGPQCLPYGHLDDWRRFVRKTTSGIVVHTTTLCERILQFENHI